MNADERTMTLLKWINRHMEEWQTICGIGKYPIDGNEYVRLQKELISLGFEDMTLVLFTNHMYAIQDKVADNLQLILSLEHNK